MRRGIVLSLAIFALVSEASAQAGREQDGTLWMAGQLQFDLRHFYVRGRETQVDEGPPLRSDAFIGAVTIGYGVTDRWQVTATLPFTALTSTWRLAPIRGINDIEAQVDVRLRGDGLQTAVVLLSAVSMPTGGPELGTGEWQMSGGVRFFKRLDPVLQFAEVRWHESFSGAQASGVNTGRQLRAHGGIGLRLDESKIVWLVGSQAYHTALRTNVGYLLGSDRFESTVGIALNWALGSNLWLDWSSTAGLSTEAPDVVLGLGITYSIGGSRSKRQQQK